MKIVCVKCQVLMKPIKNGVIAQENVDEPGRGCKIWHTDKWGCPICGYEILAGFGNGPLAEHYQEIGVMERKFKKLREHVELTFV